MMKKLEGFTLVEMLTAMAIYSLLMTMVVFTITSFSKINENVIKNDEYDEALIMENFIVKLWEKNNGSLLLTKDALIETADFKLIFSEGTLYYGNDIVAKHEKILSLTRVINNNMVIFDIRTNQKTIYLVLFSSGGNVYEK